MTLRILPLALFLLVVLPLHAAKVPATADETVALIRRVNNYWQQHHDCAPAQIKKNGFDLSPFWDHAAYQTGNMAAWQVTGDTAYYNYAVRWATHNKWQGARSKDRSKWEYRTYGEDDEHVLFADWQICFQTYADLYRICPDDYKIRRAREVMEYQMSLPDNDFWHWADALYMGMPVMTKLYRITGNQQYLDRLTDWFRWSDNLMRDPETGLYYRDGKYIYPKHTTAAGKKDFWARGDGWVLAGLAKVLQDLPAGYKNRPLFLDRYVALADAVVACQQREGYWTRSMHDPEQAPGPETSGTAFFTYGLLWGVNNGILKGEKYTGAIQRAMQYLCSTAIQKSGRVGYVQPIGEKAIPGQMINADSEANFGTGAVLLALSEWYRSLQAEGKSGNKNASDRDYWVSELVRMARPVLSNMSRGELQQNMRTEFSPSFDSRNRKVLYMECFGRLMAGIAPWLALPDDETAEGRQRKELRDMALASFRNGVDPASGDYLAWGVSGQNLVDAAYVVEAFLRAYDALWMPLDHDTKQRYIDELQKLRSIDPPYTNWLLFSSTIESFIRKATRDDKTLKGQADIYRINSAIRKVEEWYVGDGWYSDGIHFAFNYYGSYVFHPMYLETLQAMVDARHNDRIDYARHWDRAYQRCQKYAVELERFISPEGTFPVIGRSIPYRLAALQPLALVAWYDRMPAGLSYGQVRAALTRSLHRMMDGDRNYRGEYLTIGFCGSQPDAADWYTNNGSLYITASVFLPLGLPANHPFWTDAPQPWTQVKAWNGMEFPKDHNHVDNIVTRDRW